jgi:hypothetical protein
MKDLVVRIAGAQRARGGRRVREQQRVRIEARQRCGRVRCPADQRVASELALEFLPHLRTRQPADPAGLHLAGPGRDARVAEHPPVQQHVGIQHGGGCQGVSLRLGNFPNIMEGFSANCITRIVG